MLDGKIRYDDFIDGWRLTVNKVQAVEQVRIQHAHRLFIRWPERGSGEVVRQLEGILKPNRNGTCGVAVHYRNGEARAVLAFSDDWKIVPDNQLLERLRKLCGKDGVHLSYGRV